MVLSLLTDVSPIKSANQREPATKMVQTHTETTLKTYVRYIISRRGLAQGEKMFEISNFFQCSNAYISTTVRDNQSKPVASRPYWSKLHFKTIFSGFKRLRYVTNLKYTVPPLNRLFSNITDKTGTGAWAPTPGDLPLHPTRGFAPAPPNAFYCLIERLLSMPFECKWFQVSNFTG